MAGLLQRQQQQSPNHFEPRTYCWCIILSSSTICTWTSLLSSPLNASTPMYALATRPMNHAASNVESRPLNCWNSVPYQSRNWSNSQLTYLIYFAKIRVQHTLPAGNPGTVQARPRPPPTQSGSGSKMREFRTEGRSSSQAINIIARQKLKNTPKKT